MAELLEASVDLCLQIPLDPVTRDGSSYAEWERQQFADLLGSTLPANWIADCTSAYLTEAAHELGALALLIRDERVAGSVEVIVRAVIERVGRINWILDTDGVAPRDRAVRASLETGACLQHYRRAIEGLGTSTAEKKRISKLVRAQRTQVESWFSRIEKPLEEPEAPDSRPTAEVSKWLIHDQRYPSYEDAAEWALAGGRIPRRVAKGAYGALCSFSHPNYIASREHRTPVDGIIVYSYTFDYLERLCRLAAFSYGDALKHWIAYFDVDHDRIVSALDQVLDHWDEELLPAHS